MKNCANKASVKFIYIFFRTSQHFLMNLHISLAMDFLGLFGWVRKTFGELDNIFFKTLSVSPLPNFLNTCLRFLNKLLWWVLGFLGCGWWWDSPTDDWIFCWIWRFFDLILILKVDDIEAMSKSRKGIIVFILMLFLRFF